MLRKITAGLLVLLIAVTFVWIGTRPGDKPGDEKIKVAASFYPLYDFARQVGGDKVSVSNATPPGVEPHDYEPAAKDLARLQQTDVFLYNGLMEHWAEGFLRDYKGKVIKASAGIELLDGNDPHFWLDPVIAQQTVGVIADRFAAADPENGSYYKDRAKAYSQNLADLDKEFRNGLANCEQRTVVASHDAFSYVAKRYNFEVAAIAGISAEQEPSPDRLAELSRLVKQRNIKYVAFETLVSPRLADTIASETGASTLVLDPLEGLSNEDQKNGKDYLSVQRENIENLRRALACR
jgi:zinc transport system substrate-binding protein